MGSEIYRHRQTGRLMRVAMLAGIFFIISISYYGGNSQRIYILLIGAVILFVMWLFGSLNVTVTTMEVTAAFGPGWIKRRVPIGSIANVRSVRNHWMMGWGLRIIPNGVMFNVSGLDAVELELRSGRIFRIGSDEPGKLENALKIALESKGGASPADYDAR